MNAASSEDQKPVRNSLFKNRDFSLLFFGSSVSALGDQFTLVALPAIEQVRQSAVAA